MQCVIDPYVNAHGHLRYGAFMRQMLPAVVNQCAGMIAMGNTSPDLIETAHDVLGYDADVADEAMRLGRPNFQQMVIAMMTPDTDPALLWELHECNRCFGVKFMPAAGTTNAHRGIADYFTDLMRANYRALADIERARKRNGQHRMPALFHVEAVSLDGSMPFELREEAGIPIMDRIRELEPELPVTFEHISSIGGARWVMEADPELVLGTVAPQHLFYNSEQPEAGNDHRRCMPRIKDPRHQAVVQELFLTGTAAAGDDWAPHPEEDKVGPKQANGVVFGSSAAAKYIEFLHAQGRLDLADTVMSKRMADFYRIDPPRGRMVFTYDPEHPHVVEEKIAGRVVPANAGEHMAWRLTELSY